MRRALGYADLVAIGVGGIIGSGWLFSVLSAANDAGPASFFAWVVGGGISLLLALLWAEIGGLFPRTGTTSRVPYYTHGGFLGFQFGWVRYLATATIPAIEAEAVLTALAAILGRLHVPVALTQARAFGTASFATLTPIGVAGAAGLVVGFLLLNLAGISALGTANRWVTAWKVVIPLLTAGTLLTVLRPANFTAPPGGLLPYGPISIAAAIGSSGIMFAYLGFAQMLDFGGETRRPGRDMPRALLTAVGIAVGVYCLLSFAFLGAVRWTDAGLVVGHWSGLGTSPWANLPLYYAVVANPGFGFLFVGGLLLVDAGLSPTGTGWIYLGTSTRSLFGWASEGRFAGRLLGVGARGVPVLALLLTTGAALLFLLPLPSWYELVGFLSSATVLTYVSGAFAVPSLRRTADRLERPYRVPLAAIVAPAAFVAGFLILVWAGFALLSWIVALVAAGEIVYLATFGVPRHALARAEVWVVTVVLVVGWAAWAIFGPIGNLGGSLFWSTSSTRADFVGLLTAVLLLAAPWAYLRLRGVGEGDASVRASSWLPVGLAGLYVLGYVGEFGPSSVLGGVVRAYPGARVLPFPFGSLLAGILAIGMFYAAVRSAYATPELTGAAASAH
jgi:amino acid transporter